MGLPSKHIQRILFFRTDRLGDFILNLPVLHVLKSTYPNAKISVVLHPDLIDLFSTHPDIDELIPFALASQKRSFLDWTKLFFRLKRKSYDLCIISNPHKFFHLMGFLLFIPIRVGWKRKWPFFLTHAISDQKNKSLKHEAEYNLDLIEHLTKSENIKSPVHYQIPLSAQIEQFSKNHLEKIGIHFEKALLVINPYTTASHKQWPIHKFIELIQKLYHENNQLYQIVLIGGKNESQKIKNDLLPFLKDIEMCDTSGHLTLQQLAFLLKKASLLISNDSGPVHIAAAFGTKTVVLFGDPHYGSNPKRWGPWSNGKHIAIQASDIKKIETDEVWKQTQFTLSS